MGQDNFRVLQCSDNFKEFVGAKKLAIDKLISTMEETFLTNSWASTKQIIYLTTMGSYNQRIQEMRDAGIIIECKRIAGEHYYQLQTDFRAIDWNSFRLRVPDAPIQPGPFPVSVTKPVKQIIGQGNLL